VTGREMTQGGRKGRSVAGRHTTSYWRPPGRGGRRCRGVIGAASLVADRTVTLGRLMPGEIERSGQLGYYAVGSVA
jgi:hypothetical protein